MEWLLLVHTESILHRKRIRVRHQHVQESVLQQLPLPVQVVRRLILVVGARSHRVGCRGGRIDIELDAAHKIRIQRELQPIVKAVGNLEPDTRPGPSVW